MLTIKSILNFILLIILFAVFVVFFFIEVFLWLLFNRPMKGHEYMEWFDDVFFDTK